MKPTRNPFRLRASEQATSDEDFVAMFGHEVLDILPEEGLWDRLVILASAPGAGKTTLLRLFTPGVLRALHETRRVGDNQHLARRMEALGALEATGPSLLGVLIDCREQYASIEDLPLEPALRLRWFFALIEARAILATLRAALLLAGRHYPADVATVRLVPRNLGPLFEADPTVFGDALYREARTTEASISKLLDSLRAVYDGVSDGRARFGFLRLLGSSTVHVDGKAVADQALLMFDDVQELEHVQRAALRAELETRDLKVGRWIGERYQAMSPQELLSSARTSGREYQHTRKIEEWARGADFERLLVDIGNRRARSAEVAVQEFSTIVADTLHGEVSSDRLARVVEASRSLANELASGRQRYTEWLRPPARPRQRAYEEALYWRRVAILIARDLKRQQRTLGPLGEAEFERRNDSGVGPAAALFLAREHRLPYYFGLRTLVAMASFNVELFLELAGDLFERYVASITLALRRHRALTPTQQDSIFREVSRRRLANLPRDVPYGTDVYRIVNAIGELCRTETYRETAPYAPGATGVAISMRDRDILCEQANTGLDPTLDRLYNALAAAVAHNVLQARPDTRVKNREWLVFYLNRVLCPAFGLPLQYGGFRERPLTDLKRWIAEGFQPRHQPALELRPGA